MSKSVKQAAAEKSAIDTAPAPQSAKTVYYSTTAARPEMVISLGDHQIRGRKVPATGHLVFEVPADLQERFEKHATFLNGFIVQVPAKVANG